MLYAHRPENIAEGPMRDAVMKRIHDTASWKHVGSYDYVVNAITDTAGANLVAIAAARSPLQRD